MPLESKRALRVTAIPTTTTSQQYADFVNSLCAQKKTRSIFSSLSKHLGKKDKALGLSETLERRPNSEDQDDAPLIELKPESRRTFVKQNGSWVGTISFSSKSTSPLAFERHENGKKDAKYPWRDWDLSSSFQGVTILHEYNNGEGVNMDICVVHGLGGNAIDTWTADNGVMWPRDLLPCSDYFIKSRVMTFGYDSDLTDKKSLMSLEHWAVTLLHDLDQVRTAEQEKKRPLILVCHSLGGLVVRKAMTLLSTSGIKGISLSRCGLVFLATPHTGTTKADWNDCILLTAQAAVGIRPDILHHLQAFNPVSVWDKRAFFKLNPQPPFRCFAEGRKQTIKGIDQTIVTQDSATLDPEHPAFVIMEASHSTICKMRSKFGRFQSISLGINEVFIEMFGHPRFVAHAYPPQGEFWWEGSDMNETQYRLALDTRLAGRDEEMSKLKTTLTEPPTRPKLTAVKGIAGIGKTELLMKFAVEQRHRGNIFFLRAQNTRTLEDALADVCNSIGFDMIEDSNVNWERWQRTPTPERIQIFVNWLGEDCNRDSLLILDDAELFGAASIQAALKYPAWHIVMSTRDSNIRWTDREFRDIRLPPLTLSDTVSILEGWLNKLQEDEIEILPRKDLGSLAQVVHGHPLAAQNAVPFLIDHFATSDNAIEEFVRLFEHGNLDEKEVFFKFRAKDRSLWDAFNASLKQLALQEDSESAVQLLHLLPYLRTDDDSIDPFLKMRKRGLTKRPGISNHATLLQSEYLIISKWLEKLRGVSLYITAGPPRSRSLNIHPLVLQFAQLLLDEEARKDRMRAVLEVFYELNERQGGNSHGHIVPHVNHCLQICSHLDISLRDLGLASDVALWLDQFSGARGQQKESTFDYTNRIESENPFGDTTGLLAAKADHFVMLCAATQNQLEVSGFQDGHGQVQSMVIKCVTSFKGLKNDLTKAGDHRCLGILASLGEAVDSLSQMVRSTNLYPDLCMELDEFRRHCNISGKQKAMA
ncbi:hypothetical protein ACJZ2D_014402 [Fusarium nematophilum]